MAQINTETRQPDDLPLCEHDGCDQEGGACWLPDNDDPDHPSAYYCSEHAYRAGFCWGCGQFYGGFEWFDFCNPSHLCSDCAAEFDDETDYEDEEERDPYDCY